MVKYPAGYRFFPTDEEIIVEYLLKKIKNQPIPIDNIAVVNFNDHNPHTLSGVFPPLGDNEWYFFTLRNRKYENGSRPDRTTPGGFWKATVADKPISDSNGVIVGSKRSLKFFERKHSNKPIKTDWIMHEFIAVVDQPSRKKRDANDNMKMDDLVMCRIHKKTGKSDNNRGLPSEHCPALPAAPHIDLSSDYLPESNLSLSDKEHWRRAFDSLSPRTGEHEPVAQLEGVSSLEFVTVAADDLEQWTSVIEEMMTEDQQPAPQLDDEVSPLEFAADEDFWRSSLEGSPTTGEEEPESSHGVSSLEEFAVDEDYCRRAFKGFPTEEEEEQQQQQQQQLYPQSNNICPCSNEDCEYYNHNRMPSSPPQKRIRRFYQF